MTDITAGAPQPLSLVILIPVFNDWPAVELLLARIDREIANHRLTVHVLLVDDGSTDAPNVRSLHPAAIECVDLLILRRNLGHQRAIAIGLAHIEHAVPCDAVVVMDGDGEDDPADIVRLVNRLREIDGRAIVFADRARRMEGWFFRACYRLYCGLHHVLTGLRVRVGNFSAIPSALLPRLVVISELWNHYAAAVFQSRIPYESVPTMRARRLHGRTQMNFVSLVTHGLSAMSVHSERLGVRLLVAGVFGAAGAGALGMAVLWALHAEGASWTSILAMGLMLCLSLAQSLVLLMIFVFSTLHTRRGLGFLPRRDHAYFIWRLTTLFTRTPSRPRTASAAVEASDRVSR